MHINLFFVNLLLLIDLSAAGPREHGPRRFEFSSTANLTVQTPTTSSLSSTYFPSLDSTSYVADEASNPVPRAIQASSSTQTDMLPSPTSSASTAILDRNTTSKAFSAVPTSLQPSSTSASPAFVFTSPVELSSEAFTLWGILETSSQSSSIASSTATAATTAPFNVKAETSTLVQVSTKAFKSALPTKITAIPSSSTSVGAAVLASNLADAKAYNALFEGLTDDSACISGQIACVDGDIGECGASDSFTIITCGSGTQCFALPMNTTVGVEVGCYDPVVAESILGGSGSGTAATVSSAQISTAQSAGISGGTSTEASVGASSATSAPASSAGTPSEITVTIIPPKTTTTSWITVGVSTSSQASSPTPTSTFAQATTTASSSQQISQGSTKSYESTTYITMSQAPITTVITVTRAPATSQSSTSSAIGYSDSTTGSVVALTSLAVVPVQSTTTAGSLSSSSAVQSATAGPVPSSPAQQSTTQQGQSSSPVEVVKQTAAREKGDATVTVTEKEIFTTTATSTLTQFFTTTETAIVTACA